VGPKTAADLLRQFGSLKELYGRLPEVKSERLRANLEVARELVLRNQKLICLRDDLPCEFSLDDYAPKPAQVGTLRELFGGWGFKTLLHELERAQVRQNELFN
jgi:DNA polymerase I